MLTPTAYARQQITFLQLNSIIDLSLTRSMLPENAAKITLMSCSDDGVLICGGVPLSQYDSISADELSTLSFEPKNENTIFRAELFAFGTDFSKDIILIISNCENPKIVSADIPAWKYSWQWAKSRYFSFICPKYL